MSDDDDRLVDAQADLFDAKVRRENAVASLLVAVTWLVRIGSAMGFFFVFELADKHGF